MISGVFGCGRQRRRAVDGPSLVIELGAADLIIAVLLVPDSMQSNSNVSKLSASALKQDKILVYIRALTITNLKEMLSNSSLLFGLNAA